MADINSGFPQSKTVYQRWNIHHRLVHFGIYAPFILCAITGLPIKFHHKGWAQALASFFGGGDGLLFWHLLAGVLIFLTCIYHLGYSLLWAVKYRHNLTIPMLPWAKGTWTALKQYFAYQLGKSDEHPKFGRYQWKEMFDYWAVFWGMFMIGGSGLLMWFPEFTFQYFPKWFVDAYRWAHSDEAVLAVVFIFTWHFYNVHFQPEFFPMSWVWWDGKMSVDTMELEHGLELEMLTEQQQEMPGRGTVSSPNKKFPSSG
ncbi:formate dehydrogenase subunit gamma [Phosphitispora fastidiosa]|uniref:formate dehydrogenase subunit gamma n=1 Tax=Phosphitispora fastidiosa TaxID=2837202 RepID=UPI001E3EC208|nr:cytochrome b/b6 domain-containing protein [Phosphitispora fastidiosa]MBU7007565.1 cytochrome b subunit of formate dehydrogenase [Phosphitispora fastidiosa]